MATGEIRVRALAMVLAAGVCWGLAGSGTALAAAGDAAPFEGARWIAAGPDGAPGGPASEPLPIFRRGFAVRGKVALATLYVSGLGQFEAHLNGKNVTEAVLTPGWSDYRKRVYYDTFDVTALVVPGENAIGVMLGNGMYNVESPADRYTKFRGTFGQPKLIVELRLKLADGTEQRVVSDSMWRWSAGPIAFSNIYGGEDYDARREQAGWDAPGFTDAGWASATAVDGPGGKLEAETIPPVVANETYDPVYVSHPKDGVAVYDLGENMAGWPEIRVTGAAGGIVRLLPGELLDANGMVTQKSMNASPKDPDVFHYTLKGGGVETWHPRFSYSGFRYVQVETEAAAGTGAALVVEHVAGRFLHDAVAVDGRFQSSNELLNATHTLIDRAMLSNMVSVLTDCPHREKLGWLEQTHLAGASLMYNYGLGAMYAKIAADMRDAQLDDGMVPDIAPEFPVFAGGFRDSPEWGAAAILSPWTAYQFYGDLGLLRDQYPAMQRYAAYLKGKAGAGHLLAYGLGDWYDVGPKPPGVSQLTTAGVTGTAVYYQSLMALVRTGMLLGHAGDAAAYASEAAEVKAAFNARFFHPETNTYDTGSQTAEAMPLVVGLVPEDRRSAVLESLVAAIHAQGDRVTAGDVGFHYVVRALTDGGRPDVLYAMLTKTDRPSYGDQLAHGATTLTEAWDANPNSSQNHFMLGHAEEWFYRGLAGIRVDMALKEAPLAIAPAVPGGLTHVAATYRSAMGAISSEWTRDGDVLRLDVTVPATAVITFPANFSQGITLGGRPVLASGLAVPLAAGRTGVPVGGRSFQVKAGTYRFEARE